MQANQAKLNNRTLKIILALSLCVSYFITKAFEKDVVNIYSAQNGKLLKPVFDGFTKKTGIKVNILTAKADDLFNRIQAEGPHTPADIFLTTEAASLFHAKKEGALDKVDSKLLNETIPENLRDLQGYWFGFTQHPLPIFYNKDNVKPEELSTYAALTDDKWKNRVCAPSKAIYKQSLVASMLSHKTKEEVKKWIGKIVKNTFKPLKENNNNSALSHCDIIIMDTDTYTALLMSEDPKKQKIAKALSLFWPNQKGRGTHNNINGIAVLKEAKRKENAVKLIEYLASKTSQKWFVENLHQYPIIKDLDLSDTLKSWGKFKADSLSMPKLGELNIEASLLINKSCWKTSK